jgi:hypothetical protein
LDAVVDEVAFFFLNGFAGPVADVLMGAWDEIVKYDAFSNVWVAD